MSKIVIVFWSGTGNTEAMANYTAEGVRASGGEAELLGPENFSASQLTAYSAVAFGCPLWAARFWKKSSLSQCSLPLKTS